MKHCLLILFWAFIAADVSAQSGPGIKYHYGAGGFRTKREFLFSMALAKQGTSSGGTPADTVVITKQGNSLNPDNLFVKAYPNPVSEVLTVEHIFWKDGNSAIIKVHDGLGKLILEKNTAQRKDQINLKNVAPGTYSVHYYVNKIFVTSWKIVKL